MTFSLASIYWQRASSITKGFLREAMALKSKLSKLFTAPKLGRKINSVVDMRRRITKR